MIYLYALCPSLSASSDLPEGIGASPVEILTVASLGAVIEQDVDIAQIQADDTQLMTAVLAHDRVLGHFFAQTPLLPLRFGTQFKDRDAVKTFLTNQGEVYRPKLDYLWDKAEYLVKLLPQSIDMPAIASDLKGRDYFLAKKQRLQQHTLALSQQTEHLQTFLSGLQATKIPLVQSAPQNNEERLHVLLSRDAATVQQLMTDWQQQLPTWQLTCSEPLPPYHFAA
ncbi:MAG: GvpL/GvpF family gas vesicle protein [Cyanobacteria bacterium P01_F01_bin.56]